MTQTRKVTGVKTKIFTDSDGALCVQYHNTVVWRKHPDGRITLDTGGWRTATTKARMNQAFNQFGFPYVVYQEKGKWSVWCRTHGSRIPFHADTLTLEPLPDNH